MNTVRIYEVDYKKLENMTINNCEDVTDVIHRLMLKYDDEGKLII
jgi:hypothetical protein